MSALTLERLLFDASAPTDGPLIGSYLLGAGGNVVSSTTDGADEGLDVNVLNDITVDLNGIYNVSTNPTPDNVGIVGHTRNATPGDAQQIERPTVGTADSDDVTAANVHGLDTNSFLMGYDGTAWDRITATTGHLDVNLASNDVSFEVVGNVADDAADSGNPVKVGYRAVDQSSALTALSAANDRSDALSDLYRRVFVNDAPNISVNNEAVSVDDTAGGVAIPASPLAGRTRLLVQNSGNDPIYVGAGTVTTANGIEVSKGGTLALEAGEALAFKAIAPAGKTVDTRIVELA